MQHIAHIKRVFSIFVLVVVVSLAIPYLGSAQESVSDLRSTIRGALLSDPRTASLSSEQLDTMVDILAQEAVAQGMTSKDIQWRPERTDRFVASESVEPAASPCGGSYLCTMTEAWGFFDPSMIIPFALGASAMGLVWSIAEIIHRRKYPARVSQPVQYPSA